MPSEPTVPVADFKRVLGGFCTGITIITALAYEMPAGMTCQSFSSISLDPPLVAFSPARTSTTYPLIRRTGSFAVNILADNQWDLAKRFSARGTDRWSGVSWQPGHTGSPILTGALAAVECVMETEHVAGDHFVAIGRVLHVRDDLERRPLLFFRSSYSELVRLDTATAGGDKNASARRPAAPTWPWIYADSWAL
jgi:flavin reductase (DIM6/NTAB) family NADH-FMN oxidoreductase RutF